MNTFPDNPQSTPEPRESSVPAETPAFPLTPAPPRDPVWNGWDVLALVFAGVVLFFALLFLVVRLLPGVTFQQQANRLAAMPELGIGVQVLVELLLIGCMYLVVAARTGSGRFWKSLHWNWPAKAGWYIFIGVLMQAVFIFVERFLPFPKETPFDAVLQRPYAIVVIAIFSVTLGPLFEELFFRGFLYGVLRRPFGVSTAIVGTAVPFGLVHAVQYGYSWASILLIFAVGVVLAAVREKKQSLAASFLVHAAYNSVIVLIMFVATDGFRHLEKLRQV